VGIWEISPASQANVLVAILHTEATSFAWSVGLKQLIIPGPPVMGLTGMPYDHGRNAACMRALEGGNSHIFFLDSDVIAPPDTILRLLKHDKPVISGMYCRRSPPHAVPVMIKDGKWVTEFKHGSVIEVDFVGAGCLLIRRDVLENLPPVRPGKHWFSWQVDAHGVVPQGETLSEDFAFNLQCRKHGIPTLVDTSCHCLHIGFGEASYGQFLPVGATPRVA